MIKQWLEKRRKKHRSPFDRLKSYEVLLVEYKAIPFQQKIENYELLRKAIIKLYNIISQTEGIEYEKKELLKLDYTLFDVYVIPYLEHDGQQNYMKYEQALLLIYPEGQIEEINYANGKYLKYGEEKYSAILSVLQSLSNYCEKWLQEIPAIHTAIAEAKEKAQEKEH